MRVVDSRGSHQAHIEERCPRQVARPCMRGRPAPAPPPPRRRLAHCAAAPSLALPEKTMMAEIDLHTWGNLTATPSHTSMSAAPTLAVNNGAHHMPTPALPCIYL